MIAHSSLQSHFGQALYSASLVTHGDAALALIRIDQCKRLAIAARSSDPSAAAFRGETSELGEGYTLTLCPTDHANAHALRALLPHLKPRPLGLTTSAGFGDRLGLATPGHARALQSVLDIAPGKVVAPIFAQQSIREMGRTNRTPDDVLADATWGAFEAGWRRSLGADADHLKTPDDIDACVVAGFSFFTVDPGAHVDSEADMADAAHIAERVDALPWAALESSSAALDQNYAGRVFELGNSRVEVSRAAAMRAAAKYGRAIAHVATMYRHLAGKDVPFELEISVDETDTPTTHAEHIYIASELQRLGVRWVSLAPRYVGRFEKGVEYLGDLAALRADLAGHAAIARALGPYKLSLHSGSDKFNVYPIIAELTGGCVHLKTAGTSYLEALRVIARVEPSLFREIARFSRDRYPHDRATYHVSAEVSRLPDLATLPDPRLPALLDDNNTRQILHVTFGSVLGEFKPRLLAALRAHEEAHYAALEKHFIRHLQPFM